MARHAKQKIQDPTHEVEESSANRIVPELAGLGGPANVASPGLQGASWRNHKQQDGSAEIRFGRLTIPEHLNESLRIVDPNSQEAMIFSQEIRSLFEKLYPKHDLRSEPLAFLIADLDYPNAFFTKATHPPAIIITKGMFIEPDGTQGILNSVDRLAAVISHEYEHREFRKDRGETKNTKIEEGRGQWRPVRVLAEAGFDARACHELMSELTESKTITPEGYLARVADPHLSQENNLRLIATAMAALDSEKGGLKTLPIPLEEAKPELVKVVKHVSHRSWCEMHLEQAGFNLLKDSDKFRIALNLLRECKPDYPERLTELAKVFAEFDHNKLPQAQVENFVDLVIETALNGRLNLAVQVYRSFAGVNEAGAAPPLGSLRKLDNRISEFVEAKGKAEIAKAAQQFGSELLAHRLAQSEEGRLFLKAIAWSTFPATKSPDPLPKSQRHLRDHDLGTFHLEYVPWGDHVRAAKGPHAREVALACVLLGIDDTNLPLRELAKSLSADSLKALPILCKPRADQDLIELYNKLFPNTAKLSSAIADLTKERVGFRLVGGFPTNILDDFVLDLMDSAARAKEEERKRQVNPDETPGAYLERIDYQCFISEGASREFVRYCEKLLRKDPAKFGPEVREIFIGGYGEGPWDYIGMNPGDAGLDVSDAIAKGTFKHGEILSASVLNPKNNPCLNFVLNDEFNLFSNSEKVKFVSDTVRWHCQEFGNSRMISDQAGNRYDLVEDRHIPEFYGSIKELLEDAVGAKLSDKLTWGDFSKLNKLTTTHDPLLRLFAAHLCRERAPSVTIIANIAPRLGSEFSPRFKVKAGQALEKHGLRVQELPLASTIDTLNSLLNADLVPYKVLPVLMNDITLRLNVQDPQARTALAAQLLKNAHFFEPAIKARLLDIWCEGAQEELGPDNSLSSYHAALLKKVAHAQSLLNPADFKDLMVLTAERVVAQPQLARLIEERLPRIEDLSSKELEGLITRGAWGELSLEIARQDEKFRLGTYEYLTAELTPNSLEKYFEFLQERRSSYFFSAEQGDDPFAHYENDKDDDEGDAIQTRRQLIEAEKYMQLIKEARREQLKLFHLKFWSFPLEGRALFIRELLNSPDGKKQEETALFNLMADRLLPESDERTNLARKYVRAFHDAVPWYQRDVFVCALMSAAKKSDSEKLRLGQALLALIEHLDPFSQKVGQGASSNPGTDSDIRQDLRPLKSRASRPPLWEVDRWIEAKVSPNVRQQIAYRGNIIGSGSLYVAVEVGLTDGRQAVLSVLRPNAKERALNGQEIISAMVKQLKDDGDEAALMDELIEEGGELIAQELNPALFEQQFRTATRLYDGWRVVVDGDSFDFHAAKLYEYGPEFKLVEKIEGQHFDDLGTETSVELERRRRLAMANLTLEFCHILAGEEFDTDPHGQNNRVNSHTTGRFDFGGIALLRPSDQDLLFLTDTLYEAVLSADQLGNLGDATMNVLRRAKAENEQIPRLLPRAAKALNSLGDFMYGLAREDITACLGAAFAARANPIVKMRGLELVAKMGSAVPDEFIASLMGQRIQVLSPSS